MICIDRWCLNVTTISNDAIYKFNKILIWVYRFVCFFWRMQFIFATFLFCFAIYFQFCPFIINSQFEIDFNQIHFVCHFVCAVNFIHYGNWHPLNERKKTQTHTLTTYNMAFGQKITFSMALLANGMIQNQFNVFLNDFPKII